MKTEARINQMLEQLDVMRAHLIALKIADNENSAPRPELPWRNAGANGNFESPNFRITGDDQ